MAAQTGDEDVYRLLRPYVASWFKAKYGEFTEPQKLSIPLVKAGKNVLISSPTGTGKTLAAFLGILDELFKIGEESGGLQDSVYAVYVSPLRALNNDMRRNLLEPLKEI
ncbi:MAG: DEAD/DEAH box helicase, partial [Acidilobaceae archaeon]